VSNLGLCPHIDDSRWNVVAGRRTPAAPPEGMKVRAPSKDDRSSPCRSLLQGLSRNTICEERAARTSPSAWGRGTATSRSRDTMHARVPQCYVTRQAGRTGRTSSKPCASHTAAVKMQAHACRSSRRSTGIDIPDRGAATRRNDSRRHVEVPNASVEVLPRNPRRRGKRQRGARCSRQRPEVSTTNRDRAGPAIVSDAGAAKGGHDKACYSAGRRSLADYNVLTK